MDSSLAVAAALDAHQGQAGALLPVLHDIQDALGFIPPQHLDVIAAALNLSRAEVHGVISFYHDFRTTPPGRHRLKLCRAEACQAVGSSALEAHALRRLGLSSPGTSAEGAVTVEHVYCLGNCALSPSLMLDGQLYGMVDAARLDALLNALEGP
jgi:formate dehydrogenase subunit gamma